MVKGVVFFKGKVYASNKVDEFGKVLPYVFIDGSLENCE